MFPSFAISKPLLLLDIDGVLNPYGVAQPAPPFAPYTLLGEMVWLAPCHGDWLRPLCDLFHIVWASGWEHDANTLIAPILNLPLFPVIEFARDMHGLFEKFPLLAHSLPDEPLVWIDDLLPPEAHVWAAERQSPTLLIDADPAVGLTEAMIATCTRFAVEHDVSKTA